MNAFQRLDDREQMHGPIALPETLAECEVLMDRIATNTTKLKLRLDTAKTQARTEGVFQESGWFHRATAALRHLNRDRQRLQEHAAKLRREQTSKTHLRRDQVLIAVMRERLGAEEFAACAAVADARLAGEGV